MKCNHWSVMVEAVLVTKNIENQIILLIVYFTWVITSIAYLFLDRLLSYHILSWYYHIIPQVFVFLPIIFGYNTSCVSVLYCFPIQWYHIISYHILSYHIKLHNSTNLTFVSFPLQCWHVTLDVSWCFNSKYPGGLYCLLFSHNHEVCLYPTI